MIRGKKTLTLMVSMLLVLGLVFVATGDNKPIPANPLSNIEPIASHVEEFVPLVGSQQEEPVPEPTQEELDKMEAVVHGTSISSTIPIDAKYDMTPGHGSATKANPETDLMTQGFEEGIMPPTGWQLVQYNPVETWYVASFDPYEGVYHANCDYDASYTDVQDEWMISGSVDLTSKTTWYLNFAWNMSYYWGVDPYDNYDLIVKISTDGGTTWTDLWDESGEGVFDNFVWYEEQIDLSAYSAYSDCKFAFVYAGYDGAQGGFDDISVDDAAPPTGRCCYGDPEYPSCEDGITEAQCTADYSGTFAANLNCTDNPCPTLPPNDDCADVTPVLAADLPYTFTGNNEAATFDTYCQYFVDYPNVWIAFTLDTCYQDVTIDYCGSPAGWGNGWLNLVPSCDCAELFTDQSFSWTCANGNPEMFFGRLEAGTYYYPVMLDPVNGAAGDYAVTVSIGDPCPPPTPGDNCDDPLIFTLPADAPYTDYDQLTCGRGNDYVASNGEMCYNNYYGNGEDMVYEMVVTEPICVDFLLDPKGTTWTYFEIRSECVPPNGSCLGYGSNTSSTAHGLDFPTAGYLSLAAGTYYIIVDTWPSPDCIPDFDFTVNVITCPTGRCCYGDPLAPLCDDLTEGDCDALGGDWDISTTCAADPCPIINEGDACPNPISVTLSLLDLPYTFADQTNCGRLNYYDATCLGSYDGGEDIIYELVLTENMTIDIILDPKGTTWTGIVLDDECPPAASGCIATSTSSSGAARMIEEVPLAAGTYYIMVDTYPSPTCVPDFDLTIQEHTGCQYTCDSGTDEGEDCGDDTNGGCNSDTPVFGTVTCGETICGTSWADGGSRDTDWYTLELTEWTEVTVVGQSNFDNLLVFLIDGNAGCDGAAIMEQFVSPKCIEGSLTKCVAPGTYWVWAGPDDFYDLPCSSGPWVYGIEVSCVPCDPYYCDGDGGCDEYIENITVGTINNTTSCDYYGDYTYLSTDLEIGGTYSIDFTIGNAWSSDEGAVWIDFNHDYTFQAEEEILYGTGLGPYSASFDVPGDAYVGETRLRARLNYASAAIPCGSTSYGEVEDYTVNLVCVPEDNEVGMDTDPMWMYYQFAIDVHYVDVYIAPDNTGAGSAGDIDLGTVLVNGFAPDAIVLGDKVPGFSCEPTVVATINVPDFCVPYGAPVGETTPTYNVTGDFTGGGSFAYSGTFTLYGKDPLNPSKWLVPQSEVVVRADCDANGFVNVADAVFLVKFIFSGGDAPSPHSVGDCDCSLAVNIADVVHLINYIFGSGPAPCQVPN